MTRSFAYKLARKCPPLQFLVCPKNAQPQRCLRSRLWSAVLFYTAIVPKCRKPPAEQAARSLAKIMIASTNSPSGRPVGRGQLIGSLGRRVRILFLPKQQMLAQVAKAKFKASRQRDIVRRRQPVAADANAVEQFRSQDQPIFQGILEADPERRVRERPTAADKRTLGILAGGCGRPQGS